VAFAGDEAPEAPPDQPGSLHPQEACPCKVELPDHSVAIEAEVTG
jgi:hypothetical protein